MTEFGGGVPESEAEVWTEGKQNWFLFYRRFFKDMPQVALDKRSNFEYLEKEVGLKRFLPKATIDSMKVSQST